MMMMMMIDDDDDVSRVPEEVTKLSPTSDLQEVTALYFPLIETKRCQSKKPMCLKRLDSLHSSSSSSSSSISLLLLQTGLLLRRHQTVAPRVAASSLKR